MSLERLMCEDVFRGAVAACAPGRFVRAALGDDPVRSRYVYGLAIGNAAMSMLRGAGPVLHGIAITSDADNQPVPKGWSVQRPDEAAGIAIMDLVAAAGPDDVILVLLSGGAEHSVPATLRNGGLAQMATSPIRTIVASHVAGDDLTTLCGAPTIPKRPIDRATVIANGIFAGGVQAEMIQRHYEIHLTSQPRGYAFEIADSLVDECSRRRHPIMAFLRRDELSVSSEEEQQGRAITLALALSRAIAGLDLTAFCATSTGWDGAHRPGRPHPAGAFVDGKARHDTRDDLERAGALVYTQLTGLDYGGEIAIVG